MIKTLLRLISVIYYKLSGNILTYKIFNNNIMNSYDINEKVAIIIQGNIIADKNFLLQTIHNYRKMFPNVLIVISIWVDSDKKVIEKIKKIKNIKIIINDYPKFSGIKNINLQIISTVNALNYLKENNFKYALKTRTDQIIYQRNSNYLMRFIEIITENSKDLSPLKSKLIFSTMNSFKDRYYSISDMLMFGLIDDLLVYWNCDLDTKKIKDIKVESNNLNFMRQGTAEGYLLLKFMDNIDYVPKWSDECSNFFIRNYFHPIDYEYLEQFWYKNNWHIDYGTRYNNTFNGADYLK
ncbi:MAG: hypothetical protein CMC86_05525 [Flavobacteriaceae bacterium]|nr:hypothetical protein [Flavobacteriaceae bacterium]|tara:strand:+ start:17113 stop:17997 length:885 start_codon:yes stop_codon:yes gene_type:complete